MPELIGNTGLRLHPAAKMSVDRVLEGRAGFSIQPAAGMTYVPASTWPIPEFAFSLIHWCANNSADLLTVLGELPGRLWDLLSTRARRSGRKQAGWSWIR